MGCILSFDTVSKILPNPGCLQETESPCSGGSAAVAVGMGMMAWISSEKGRKTEMGRMVCASATIRQPQLVPTYSFLSRMVREATCS